MKPRPPLLVDIGLLTGRALRQPGTGTGSGAEIPGAVLRVLAELHRADRPLVLLAERPDRWAPTRNRVDRALEGQSRIEREIQRGGGVLDAVLYLDFGMFSRRRKRRDVLADLAARYGTDRSGLAAIVGSDRMADAVRDAVGQVVSAGSTDELVRALGDLA